MWMDVRVLNTKNKTAESAPFYFLLVRRNSPDFTSRSQMRKRLTGVLYLCMILAVVGNRYQQR